MNPTRIAIIVIVIVLVAGAVYLFTTSNNQPTVNDTTEINQQEEIVDDDTQMEADADAVVIEVSGANFSFTPSTMTVKKGQKVKVVFTANDLQHDFVIDELDVRTQVIPAGSTTEVEFTPTEAGEFEYYCSVGQHRANGMVGTLTVTE